MKPDEVRVCIPILPDNITTNDKMDSREFSITQICNLAYEPITKDKIVGAFKNFKYHFIPENFDRLATEILNDKE